MRRPPKGATNRPALERPGSGYGRSTGRPEPGPAVRVAARVHRRWWETATDLVDAAVAQASPVGDGTPPELFDHQR
ncbi:MAG TPA: hypothetical protein VF152_10755 [Acidimicrobiia bacterium]